MAKILLTGSAGSVGYETLKKLLDNKHQVIALEKDNKKNRQKLNKYKEKATIIYGDIRNKELIENIIKNVDCIIHLAAIIPPLADSKPELTYDVNYNGTKNIVDCIKKINSKIFLIFSSSVSVYGDRIENYWIKTSDPLIPSEGDYYASVKIATEKYIQKNLKNYTIFRLTGIMNRPQTDPLMFHMPLNTKIEIATVYDTARALTNAVDHQKELNKKIFNLGGGVSCRTVYKDFLINMFKIYGLQIKYLKNVAFATQNFHCGYFLDSDKLEEILHFRKNSLEDYYNIVNNDTKGIIRFLAKIFSQPIIYFLNKKSEPLIALKKKDKNLITRFFGNKKN